MQHTTPDNCIRIKDDLIKKINADELEMRPKMYFTLKLTVLIVLAALVLGISIFLFNFILYSIHAQAIDSLLTFGSRGWMSFFSAFPWLLTFIDVACMAAFYFIARCFHRGYRTPIMWGVLTIVVVTIASGAIIDTATPINSFLHKDHPHYLPPQVKAFYLSYERPAQPMSGTCLCNVSSVGTSSLMAWNDTLGSSTQFTIIVPANEPYATTSGLTAGDVVIIAGEEVLDGNASNTIRAFGIRKVMFDY